MATSGEVSGQQPPECLGSEDFCEIICEPCQLDGKLLEAIGVCTDCQEYLCRRCFDAHKIPRPFRNHELLEKEQMLQNQLSIERKDKCTEKCTQHEDKVIKYYCTSHSQLGCSVCITMDHRACEGVRYIPNVAKDLENNEEYKQVEQQLQSAVETSKRLSEDADQKIKALENDCIEVLKIVAELKKEIIDALDKVHAEIIKQCETLKSVLVKKVSGITENCKIAQSEMQSLMANIESLQDKRQNCDLYIAMMNVKEKLQSLDIQLKEAEGKQSNRKSRIKFVPDQGILSQLQHPVALGKLSATKSGNIADVEHIQDINVKTGTDKLDSCITGSVILSENKLVLADWSNGSLKAVDVKNGQLTSQLKPSSAPWDIAEIDNEQIAVSLPNEGKVAFVTVGTTLTVSETIDIAGTCRGVAYRGGKLAVTICNPDQVQILDLQGTVLHCITNDNQRKQVLNYPYYLAIDLENETTYVSNSSGNNLVQMKFDGTVVTTYADNELRSPRKVAIDDSGTIYVCTFGSHNVNQVSADCKKIKVLLDSSKGLHHVYSISYSETDNKFYIGMWNNNVVKVFQAVHDNQ